MQVIQYVVYLVEYNKHRWYRHVRIMKEECFPKILIERSPEGRRRTGKPKMPWESFIRKTMKIYKLYDEFTLDRER